MATFGVTKLTVGLEVLKRDKKKIDFLRNAKKLNSMGSMT